MSKDTLEEQIQKLGKPQETELQLATGERIYAGTTQPINPTGDIDQLEKLKSIPTLDLPVSNQENGNSH